MPNLFEKYIINNNIIINEFEWNLIINNYSQDFIISELSNAIELYDIKLPYKTYTNDNFLNDFNELIALDTNKIICEGEWVSKFNYKYPFINKYINTSNVGNIVSDYFHQKERWKCDATGYPSPERTWYNEKFRLTLFKALFSLKVKEINPTIFRNIIGLRKYIAAQFRPSAAKAIYDYFKSETVLDFSMGWGDRIAGAFASNYVKKYVGIDPNLNLFDGYYKQINTYESIKKTNKEFSFIVGCAEDENIKHNELFDLIFTSPPYYDKEKYDMSQNQSYVKYKSFDSWLNNFLYKTINIRTQSLKSGGFLVINISDIYTRKKLYNICDNMNDYIKNTKEFEYVGAIGLRMPKRPMSISFETNGVYCEPIWIWQKK